MLIVVMGVSGAGKTTVGMALATALGWPFVDADEFHAPSSIEMMRRGEPLSDAGRDRPHGPHREKGQYRKALALPHCFNRAVLSRDRYRHGDG